MGATCSTTWRSIIMLTPGVPALSREEAISLLEELTELQERLDWLQTGLRQLLDEAEGHKKGTLLGGPAAVPAAVT